MTEVKKEQQEKKTPPSQVPYIVWESAQVRSERTIRRLSIAIAVISVIAIITVFVTAYLIDKGWRDYLSDSEIQTYEYTQDGKGVNIIGSSNGVDYKNESEVESQEDNTEE